MTSKYINFAVLGVLLMNLFDFFSFFFHTHNKKSQADAALCGRSMVEMLGVLAIIGVLSIGAISGYSKAMFKYKLNKQAEQISSIVAAAYTYLGKIDYASNYASYMYIIDYFMKLNLIPPEMSIKNNNLIGAAGSNIRLHIGPDKNHMYINVAHYPGDNKESLSISDRNVLTEICMQTLLVAKTYAEDPRFAYVYVQAQGLDTIYLYGPPYCRSSVLRCFIRTPVEEMHRICYDMTDKYLEMFIIFNNQR